MPIVLRFVAEQSSLAMEFTSFSTASRLFRTESIATVRHVFFVGSGCVLTARRFQLLLNLLWVSCFINVFIGCRYTVGIKVDTPHFRQLYRAWIDRGSTKETTVLKKLTAQRS